MASVLAQVFMVMEYNGACLNWVHILLDSNFSEIATAVYLTKLVN